jgi:LmbE family N-acetylglucosaminyl deacetylase
VVLFRASFAVPVDVLVVAPHPDDDTITSAGVTYRAVAAGKSVRLVYMTNGDADWGTSKGLLRQDEVVAAAVGHLGMQEEDLIFLGYPDGYLQLIDQSYTEPTDQFEAPWGQDVTYGVRGLGGSDYHTHRFGSPGPYNRPTILMDLADILTTLRPKHIFVTSEWDQHPDHSTTYALVSAALASVFAGDPTYVPTVHKTIVWNDPPGTPKFWPNPMNSAEYHVEPTNLHLTDLEWDDRESIDVPVDMQSTLYSTNPKYRAIAEHVSQGGTGGFLGRFLHKDEIYWVENQVGANQPPRPDAGLDQLVSEGEVVQLDASGSTDPDTAILTYQWAQTGGVPVTMSDPESATPTFEAPMGLVHDETLTFELVVADGELTSIPDSVLVRVDAISTSNIAPIAAVTASSENPPDGQQAVKAVDGVVDGYPGDYTREWATDGENDGAWITLTWARPYSVNHIVLYDRPNSDDQILSATLLFSDGSTIVVGALDNSGLPTEVTFPPRVVTSVRLTVNTTSAATQNVGLAEIEVFRTSSVDADEDGWTVADGDCLDHDASSHPQGTDTSCNGVDENCSGAADEGYVPEATACGVGACVAAGTTSCVAGNVVDGCVPGAPSDEVCDGADNDCNGVTDDAPAPEGTPGLVVATADLSWSAVPGATGYDVVRGSLGQLLTSGGDFAAATKECLADDLAGTSISYTLPPGPGQASWFLARAVGCGGAGSFNSGAPSQAGDRDPGVAASPLACP